MFINLNPHLDLGFFYFLKSFCKNVCLIVYFSLHLLIINYNIMGRMRWFWILHGEMIDDCIIMFKHFS